MKVLWKAALAALLCVGGQRVSAVMEGFEDRLVMDAAFMGGGLITDFTWLPDGSLVVVKKEGQVDVFTDPAGDNTWTQKTIALNIAPFICDNSERGVEGVEAHPDFENNRFIYLYYTFNKNGNCNESPFDGPVNRLSRFILPATNVIDVNSETVLFETASLEYDHHNSGDIAFGNDGYIYVSVGDGGSTFSALASDPGNLLGSMIRIKDDGSIPPENPYTFQSGEENSVRCNATGVPPPGSPEGAKCQEIFAIGLRNPFRFSMDPNTVDKVRLYFNDVGQAKWEEVSEITSDDGGAHYGWPEREGPCANSKVKRCATAHPYKDPVHFYIHDGGGAVTGSAFVPNGVWPAEFDGAYIYGDYVFDEIYMMRESGQDNCIVCEPPESRMQIDVLTDYTRILNIKFGPYGDTQALYYSGIPGVIRRVTYVGSGNRSPEAVILPDKTEGSLPLTVTFNGAASTDGDGDTLSFEWDFDGDGVIDSTRSSDTFTYTTAGVYTAQLTVSDGNGGETTAKVEISAGNKPVPTIVEPATGTTFAVGDIITLVGRALDEENGVLPDTALTWEVRQHHDDHYHPFLGLTTGNNIQLSPAPEPEDYAAAGTSFLEIILTATDSDGLSSTVSMNVEPRLVLIDFDTIPSGLDVILDGTPITTPATAITWEGHGLKVEAPDQFVGDQAFVFSSWSNGGARSHTIPIGPATNTVPKYVAEFSLFTGTFPPTAAPTKEERCIPTSLGGLLAKLPETNLESGNEYVHEECNVFIVQQGDGNLVVYRGTPDNEEGVLWESGVSDSSGTYHTTLQGDGNMITRKGASGSGGENVWTTAYSGKEGDYFLGIDCNCEFVSVYSGTPLNPGAAVWNSAPTPAPTGRPTGAPTMGPPPTARPTAAPTSADQPVPTEGTNEPDGSPPVDEPDDDSSSFVLSKVFGFSLTMILLQCLI